MPLPAVIQLTSPGWIACHAAKAVAVQNFTIEKIGDGSQADVRMRPHIQSMTCGKRMRAHLVEKDEGPDHALLPRGQGAPHFEVVAQVGRARHHHDFQCAVRRQLGCFGMVFLPSA